MKSDLACLSFGVLVPIVCLVLVLTGVHGLASAAEPGDAALPASVAEARGALDLTTFPGMNGAKEPVNRSLARLSYLVPADCQSVFDFHRQTLADRKWSELPGSTGTEQYGSGMFTRDRFLASLTVSKHSDPTQPGTVSVSLTLHGNVDLARLPVPDGAKPMFVGPQVAMYTADAPVADTVEACRELLVARGWQPYGQAGNTSFFKQNAIRLTVAIAAAPGQGGKTSISYTAEQLSADLPAPSDTVRLQYADSTKQLSFDTNEDEAAILAFYRDSLTSNGWKATTETPLQIDWKKVLIFRNDARDMLTLELYHVKAENLLRVTLKHQSAAEVDAVDARLDAQMAAKTAKQVPQEKVPVSVPAGARLTAQTPTRVEFTISAAQTAAVAQSLRKTFRDGGWTEKETMADGTIGEITWTKANHELSLSYVNTGFTPAEFTLRAKGVELEVAGR